MKPLGLNYWLTWLKAFDKWIDYRPFGIGEDGWYTVENVPYQDLVEIADHFEEDLHPEDYKHQKRVEVTWNKAITIEFKSPSRGFTYHDIEG